MNRNLQLERYLHEVFKFDAKDYQVNFTYDCLTRKRIVAVFCRQSGKTETTSKVAIMLAMRKKRGDVLIFAPTDRQTGLMSAKIRLSLMQMPRDLDFKLVKSNQRSFYFNNGRAIICETTGDSGETIRGYTAGDIILEEAGSIKDSIVNDVIMPMGNTTDPTIIKIGTPRGKNHFFESSINTKWALHQYDYTHPVRTGLMSQEYIDNIRESIPFDSFNTEYGAQFIEDQDAYFKYDLIEACKDASLSWDAEPMADWVYYMGCDIARLGQDSTCLIVVGVDKQQNARVVKIRELQHLTLDVTMDKIEELMLKYKCKRVFIDETGLGAGVSDVLAKKYNPVKIPTGQMIRGFKPTLELTDRIVGVKFTIQSKLDMYSNLKTLMSRNKLKYGVHPKLIAQLRDFRYELTENQNVKLHHSEYGHDDFTDALVLACKEANVKRPGFAI